MPDDAVLELFFEADELLEFALEQAGDRDAGPPADDFGDVFAVHLFTEELAFGGDVGKNFLIFGDFAFEGRDESVLQFGGAGPIEVAFGVGEGISELFELLLLGA